MWEWNSLNEEHIVLQNIDMQNAIQ